MRLLGMKTFHATFRSTATIATAVGALGFLAACDKSVDEASEDVQEQREEVQEERADLQDAKQDLQEAREAAGPTPTPADMVPDAAAPNVPSTTAPATEPAAPTAP